MAPLSAHAGRRCHAVANSVHSTVYFAEDLDVALAGRGIGDPMAAYLAGRAAPLGTVGPGVVTAVFDTFAHSMVARHVPGVWDLVAPAHVLDLRRRAVEAVLRRLLGDDLLAAPEVKEAADLALAATDGAARPGRPLFAANADLDVPDEPHLALWHATTLLREHRGDGHVAVLAHAELTGVDALVSHCASDIGMPREMVMTKRGWSEVNWSAAEDRLRDRGLMTAAGALTTSGVRLRAEIEDETDRLDRLPYEHLGADGTARLEALLTGILTVAADAGAFPPPLRSFFVPA